MLRPSRIFHPTSVFDIKPGETRIVAGDNKVMSLRGGVFAMGSATTHKEFNDTPPRMVSVDPFSIGVTPLTRFNYEKVMSGEDDEKKYGMTPKLWMDWYEANRYIAECNTPTELSGTDRNKVRLPTEAEWEFAARGPVIDVRAFMEEMRFRSAAELVGFLKEHGSLENFVPALALSARIITDIESDEFKEMIDSTGPVYAWRAYATRDGKLDPDYAWHSRWANVSETLRLNGYGLADMLGFFWQCCWDVYDKEAYLDLPQENPRNDGTGDEKHDRVRVLRGMSWHAWQPWDLHVANRSRHNYSSNSFTSGIGIRVAAAP